MNFCNIKENLLAYRAETGGHPLGLDRVFGFALIRAWVYLMFVGAAASFMTWSGEAIRPAFFLVSAGALCIALFGSALTGDRFVKLMLHPTARAAGPTLTGVGTVLLASSGAEGMIGDVCGIIGAITTGLGSGIIDLGYGELYRNEPPGRTTFEVPLAFFLAAVAYSLTAMLPPVTSCVLCALLPVVSGWILFVQQHAWSRKRQPTVRPIEFDLKSFAWRIGLCACLVGIADGMVRAAFLSSNNLSIHLLLQWPLAGAGLITMLIVYGAALLGSEQSTRTIYKAAIVVMAFFFMLLPIFTGAQDIESVLALTGYGTFNVLIWMLLAEISANYRLSSTRVFGIGWGMVTLGVLLGAVAGDAVDRFAPFSPQFLSFIALVATMAVLLSFFVRVPRERPHRTDRRAGGSVEREFFGNRDASRQGFFKECCRRATSTKIVNAASNAAPALPGPLPGSGRRLRAVAQGDRGDDPLRQGPLGRPHSRGAVYLEGDREHPFAPHLPEDGRPFQTGNARRHRRRHEGVGPHPVGVLPASMDFPTFSLVGLRILWQKAVSGCGLEAKTRSPVRLFARQTDDAGEFPP